jgi:hypothetical protein
LNVLHLLPDLNFSGTGLVGGTESPWVVDIGKYECLGYVGVAWLENACRSRCRIDCGCFWYSEYVICKLIFFIFEGEYILDNIVGIHYS